MNRLCKSLAYMTELVTIEDLQKCETAEVLHKKRITDLTDQLAKRELEYEIKISKTPTYEGPTIVGISFFVLACVLDHETIRDITMLAFGAGLGALMARGEVIVEADRLSEDRKRFEREKFIFDKEELVKEKNIEKEKLNRVYVEKKKLQEAEEVIQEEKQRSFYSL